MKGGNGHIIAYPVSQVRKFSGQLNQKFLGENYANFLRSTQASLDQLRAIDPAPSWQPWEESAA